jgi:hypothetical protein
MNYYEKGGGVHGLKALAQDLQSKGRGGDTILAHINPEEARMLKAMGGSGTINPETGLPEFIFKAVGNAVSGGVKAVANVTKAVVQPIYNATLKQIPGVDNALKGLDRAVGKAIPGGWGTVAAIGASFIPGAQLAAMGMTKTGLATGLGALSGSGALRGKGEFNLQGAIMGGAMAYGASQLTQGLQNAGGAVSAAEEAAKADTARIAANLGVEGASTGAGSQAAMLASQNAGMGAAGLESIKAGANTAIESARAAGATIPGANVFAYAPSGEMVPSNVASSITGAAPTVVPQPTGLQALGTNLADAGSGTLSNMGSAAKGVQNLTGFGEQGISGIAPAAKAFAAPITTKGITAGLMGYSGMAALEEQKKMLAADLANGKIAQDQYNAAVAEIDRSIADARKAVADNPFKSDTDVSGSLTGSGKDKEDAYDTLYDTSEAKGTLYSNTPTNRSTIYAAGGEVYGAAGSPLGNLGLGSMGNPNMGYPDNAGTPYGYAGGGGILGPDESYNASGPLDQGFHFAAGGDARFLSGGGDGMSDSIKARINGAQEARLADGEFVIPADVVSHLGNGSSKAGAKQLYSMMDRARKARTGRKSQGKQINPRKYMPA